MRTYSARNQIGVIGDVVQPCPAVLPQTLAFGGQLGDTGRVPGARVELPSEQWQGPVPVQEPVREVRVIMDAEGLQPSDDGIPRNRAVHTYMKSFSVPFVARAILSFCPQSAQ